MHTDHQFRFDDDRRTAYGSSQDAPTRPVFDHERRGEPDAATRPVFDDAPVHRDPARGGFDGRPDPWTASGQDPWAGGAQAGRASAGQDAWTVSGSDAWTTTGRDAWTAQDAWTATGRDERTAPAPAPDAWTADDDRTNPTAPQPRAERTTDREHTSDRERTADREHTADAESRDPFRAEHAAAASDESRFTRWTTTPRERAASDEDVREIAGARIISLVALLVGAVALVYNPLFIPSVVGFVGGLVAKRRIDGLRHRIDRVPSDAYAIGAMVLSGAAIASTLLLGGGAV